MMESPSRLKRFTRVILLAVRTLQVRLRFILILAAAFAVVGRWDTLRNYVDRWMSGLVGGGDASRSAPPNSEYFCPMDPAVVSTWPGKCDICNMALVRRKVGDAAPLPSGVLARMQLSPYRIQLAGIQTALVEYRPVAREVALSGIVRDEGLVRCRVLESDRPFVVAGQAAEVTVDDGARQPAAKGKVIAVAVDPRESRTNAEIRLDEPGRMPASGTRVVATVRRPVAELEPFRSLPSDLPPLVKGELLAVYACPRHAEVLASDRGRCPVDRNDELQRRPLLANQRVRWWCPMHPNITAEKSGASCEACGGMTLIPRIITYRPRGEVLTVPESAVVDTGNRAVVFVEGMPGMFDSVEIVAGPRCGDVYPVASGLEPGQRVATRGAFLLDAETRLNPGLAAGYFGASRGARDDPAGKAGESRKAADPGVCPVSGKPLGSMGPPVSVTIDGQTVPLCCKGCEARLRASPEKYLPGKQPR
ncbi:heavy metal-binding domain-containing protein [Aquisphaera insulae]|uniref:heavy metal-binding domain-containing protein n=1 Tax=Aquisphaera insulae TaxID=2712864 RepID=UPI0013EC3310|nr:heavy metal-binding domain-containing protein [Aquisphaera insulae]